MRRELEAAAYDYYTLLARGHRHRDRILALLAATYKLTAEEKAFLKRCIHPPTESKETLRKIIEPREAAGKTLIIDLPNQASPIKATLMETHHLVARCTDGLTRDSVLGATKPTPRDTTVYRILAEAIKRLNPHKTIIVIDSAIPHSGQTAAKIRQLIPWAITATSKKADTTIILRSRRGKNTVVASSDTVIARRVEKLLDLAALAITTIMRKEITDLRKILSSQHREWCQEQLGP